ncbi:hypothetical protein C8R46DRAFT_1046843 [Mycena filopes]|nr:hypothetical protein C8R46DRAFT_1046843 [Mycena filopes]
MLLFSLVPLLVFQAFYAGLPLCWLPSSDLHKKASIPHSASFFRSYIVLMTTTSPKVPSFNVEPAPPRRVAALKLLAKPPLLPSTFQELDGETLVDVDIQTDEDGPGPFGRLMLGSTMLFLGLVHAGVITMCTHAFLAIFSPDRYLPSLAWSPAIGAVGLLLSLIIGVWTVASMPLIFFFFPVSDAMREVVDTVIPWVLQTATPPWLMFAHYIFGIPLSVFVLSIWIDGLDYANAFNIGIAAAVLHLLLQLAQGGTDSDILFGGLRLIGEVPKGALITLCGHAVFIVLLPSVPSTNYAASLDIAAWPGVIGAFFLVAGICCTHEPEEREEMKYINCAHVLYVAATNAFLGACTGALLFGVLGGFTLMIFGGPDILSAIGVGLVGGTLMGLIGIRPVFM